MWNVRNALLIVILAFKMFEYNPQLREIKHEVSRFKEEIIHLIEGQEREGHKTFDKENYFATFIKDSPRLI